jgi:hypothetical protein
VIAGISAAGTSTSTPGDCISLPSFAFPLRTPQGGIEKNLCALRLGSGWGASDDASRTQSCDLGTGVTGLPENLVGVLSGAGCGPFDSEFVFAHFQRWREL